MLYTVHCLITVSAVKIKMKNLCLRGNGSISDVCCILILWQQQTRPGRIKPQWDPGCCDDISAICSHSHCLRVTVLHFQGQKAASVILLLVEKVVPTSGAPGLKTFGYSVVSWVLLQLLLQAAAVLLSSYHWCAAKKWQCSLCLYADSLAADAHPETFNDEGWKPQNMQLSLGVQLVLSGSPSWVFSLNSTKSAQYL